MSTLVVAALSMVGFLIAYHTYGRWLSRKIFGLDPRAAVPSVQLNDNRDFVPTPRSIVFGHHFTSIAGTGPIVGPAIAIMWGWVPALLWVIFGSIFIGAVHDFGALVVSLRNRGQTVGDIAGRVLNPRVRFLFLTILLFSLWIVLAIFGLVIASVFKLFPASILPVFLQIPIAVVIGIWLHRRGIGLLVPSIIALGLMYATVWLGAGCPGVPGDGGQLGDAVRLINQKLSSLPIAVWTAVLLGYCYIASVLPVWTLLQPRDYINSLQLISSLLLVVVGLCIAGTVGVEGRSATFVAPAVQWHPLNAPPIFPVLFITIACGAISGFHCLVSSGTTSKQLRCETDAHFVGYGSMLLEAFLAVLVILAVAAGIGFGWPTHAQFGHQTGAALWHSLYADWNGANALGNTVGAFVAGSANFLGAMGVNYAMALAIMGVLVASFAGTTLDTATRLQRYVIQELGHSIEQRAPAAGWVTRPLQNAYAATLFAVVTALLLAVVPKAGQPWNWSTVLAAEGGVNLWPMFGATNQLLGGLAFMVICFWLWRRGKPIWFAIIPGIFMLIMPAWAMAVQVTGWGMNGPGWIESGQWLLVFIALVALSLETWMVVEALVMWPRAKGVLEEALPPLVKPHAPQTAGGRSC